MNKHNEEKNKIKIVRLLLFVLFFCFQASLFDNFYISDITTNKYIDILDTVYRSNEKKCLCSLQHLILNMSLLEKH